MSDAMGDGRRQWFAAGRQGLSDYLAVVEDSLSDMPEGMHQSARVQLERAQRGDWAGLETALREEGAALAGAGVDLEGWFERNARITRAVVPRLAAAYHGDPERLAAALGAMDELHGRTVGVICDEYFRARENRYRLIFHGSPLPMYVFDMETLAFLEVNDAAVQLYGFERAELLRMTLRDIRPPEDVPALLAYVKEPFAETESYLMRHRKKDGSLLQVEARGYSLPMAGRPARLVVIYDLTEIHRLREERDAERRFRALLEAAPDAMIIAAVDGQIELANTQAERLFGYRREELLAQKVEALVPERFAGAHPGHRGTYAAEPTTRPMGVGQPLAGRRKDGSEFPAEISLSPIRTTSGLSVMAAVRDVTERRQTENALKLANQELESFSYSVAHDLRAPLRAVNGFALMLAEAHGDKLDEEGRDWLREIVGNAKKMSGLIDALLGLARLTRAALRPEPVDLAEVARASLAQLRAAEPERVVEVVIADELPAHLDATLARALMDNLLGNAWKFTSGKPAARIEVGCDEERVFFVRDNGAGFDMTYAGKLFAPFQRLHSVAEFPGTGIGLATVQRILHRHGGQIRAEGAVGEGACFRFSLPSLRARARP